SLRSSPSAREREYSPTSVLTQLAFWLGRAARDQVVELTVVLGLARWIFLRDAGGDQVIVPAGDVGLALPRGFLVEAPDHLEAPHHRASSGRRIWAVRRRWNTTRNTSRRARRRTRRRTRQQGCRRELGGLLPAEPKPN